MLLEMAVADALAIPFEYVDDPDKYGLKNDLSYQQHPRFQTLIPSCYTDDTLRTIATAKVLISDATPNFAGNRAFNPTEYVAAIMREYANDQRYGWSRGFQQYLETNHSKSPTQFMVGLSSKATNGAIMGCLPCGYLPDPRSVILAASAQAMATHSTTTIPYAQALALAVFFYRNISAVGLHCDMIDFVTEHMDDSWLTRERHFLGKGIVPSTSAFSTAVAVFDLLGVEGNDSLTKLVSAAIELGGDTDTSAALAVGIASHSLRYKNDFTPEMVSELDLGRSDRRFAQVSYDLATLYPSTALPG